MDFLNNIYIILGTIASAIAVITAIWGAAKLAKNFYNRSKQQSKSPIYIPYPNRKQDKSKIKRVWVITVIIIVLGCIIGFLFFPLRQRLFNSPVSSMQNDCPAYGTARPATMIPLQQHSDPNIIYLSSEYSFEKSPKSMLERYDINSGSRSVIVGMLNTEIDDAVISSNGQWILFIVKESAESKLEMIRVDGQHLQTLYCTYSPESISDVLWSKDQKQIVFVRHGREGRFAGDTLLNITNGVLEPLLTPDECLFYAPYLWLDTSHIYMLSSVTETTTCEPFPSPGSEISLLDINNGPNQHYENLLPIAELSENMSIAINPDRKQLFIADAGSSKFGVHNGSSSISVQSGVGGKTSIIYHSSTLIVTDIRAITSTTLLLLIYSATNDTRQNGLWKMNSDGSHLIHLVTDNSSGRQFLNYFSEDFWCNASRDGNMYAFEVQNQDNSSILLFGSIKGGPPTPFFSASSDIFAAVVGWTTI
jgi:hypothetical protein